MIRDILDIAGECINHPQRRAVWSPEVGRYMCPDTAEGQRVALNYQAVQHPPIDPQFKLVFLAAVAGTVLFTVLCILLTLLAGEQLPSLLEKIVMGLFDLAKIGFGAIVGLLGGKRLDGAKA
jgi:hypothetical protein